MILSDLPLYPSEAASTTIRAIEEYASNILGSPNYSREAKMVGCDYRNRRTANVNSLASTVTKNISPNRSQLRAHCHPLVNRQH